MSAVEGFRELTERLKREREAPRAYDRVAEKPHRPPLSAPLRLPAGDPRRRLPLVPGERARQPGSMARKAGREDLPPPATATFFAERLDRRYCGEPGADEQGIADRRRLLLRNELPWRPQDSSAFRVGSCFAPSESSRRNFWGGTRRCCRAFRLKYPAAEAPCRPEKPRKIPT